MRCFPGPVEKGAPELTRRSGASAIVLIDLKQEDSELAAKELVDWFGGSTSPHLLISPLPPS
jgi:hypothetical protein